MDQRAGRRNHGGHRRASQFDRRGDGHHARARGVARGRWKHRGDWRRSAAPRGRHRRPRARQHPDWRPGARCSGLRPRPHIRRRAGGGFPVEIRYRPGPPAQQAAALRGAGMSRPTTRLAQRRHCPAVRLDRSEPAFRACPAGRTGGRRHPRHRREHQRGQLRARRTDGRVAGAARERRARHGRRHRVANRPGRAPHFQVGTEHSSGLEAVVFDGQLGPVDMVLGGEYLRLRKIWISYSRREVRITSD